MKKKLNYHTQEKPMLETNRAVLRESGMTGYRARELIQFVGGLG